MNNSNMKVNLLLFEILLMTLFFAVSAGICMNIFAKSFQMSINSRALNEASIHAQSAASCYKATNGDLQKTADYLSAELNGNLIEIKYNKHWEITLNDNEAVYVLRLEQQHETRRIDIKMINISQEIPIFMIPVGVA